MKNIASITLAVALLIGAALPVSAEGATRYANCKALNADYPGGVAKAAGSRTRAARRSTSPSFPKRFMRPIRRATGIRTQLPARNKRCIASG